MTEAMYDLLHVLDVMANIVIAFSGIVYVIHKITKGKNEE